MNNEIKKNNQIIETRAEQLAKRIEALVVDARKKIASTVNVAMVYTYFEVGRYIVEDEQDGKTRRFFLTFSKSATPQRILAEGENSATVQRKFVLSWNHYQILSHVENPEARGFYEIEAFKQQWSVNGLQNLRTRRT